MSNNEWFSEQRSELMQAMYQHYQQHIQQTMEAESLEGWDLTLAQIAYARGDSPVRAADAARHVPFSGEDFFSQRLAGAAERGFLEQVGDDGYRLSARGRELVDRLQGGVDAALADAPVDVEAAEAVTGALRKHVEGCLGCDIEKPNLSYSRRFDPGADAPVLQRLRRAVNDLNAFRDDAHTAAWRELGVSGHEWEAFSHVWGEKVWGDSVATAAEVAEKLGFRGYDANEYREALEASVGRGWLAHDGDRYVVTEEGRRVREAAEAKTDELFFEGWQHGAEESESLRATMKSLAEQLKETAPQPQEA